MKSFISALAFLLASLNASAANLFVYNATAGSGCTLGECWQNAYPSMCDDDMDIETHSGFAAATDFIYVHSAHDSDFATSDCDIRSHLTTGEGADYPVARWICVAGDTTGTTPGARCATPTAIQRTNGSALDISMNGPAYFWGISFLSDDNILIGHTNAAQHITLDNCKLELDNTGANNFISLGQNAQNGLRNYHLINTDVEFNAAQAFETSGGTFTLDGGVFTDTGNSTVTIFEINSAREYRLYVRNYDFSDLDEAGSKLVDLSIIKADTHISFERVEVHSNTALVSNAMDDDAVGDSRVEFYNVGSGVLSGTPSLMMEIYTAKGEIILDKARTLKTGAASDGATDYSWSFDTSTSTQGQDPSFYDPLVGPPIQLYLAGDGTNSTLRFFLANSAQIDDDDFWITCSTFTSAADSHLGKRWTTRPDPLVAGTGITADAGGDTWDGSDESFEMQLDIVVAPDGDGVVTCIPFFALDAERISLSPNPTVNP